MNRVYFNVICEEFCVFGGKIIHLDKNVGSMEDVHKLVCENMAKFPNAKWELHLMNFKA